VTRSLKFVNKTVHSSTRYEVNHLVSGGKAAEREQVPNSLKYCDRLSGKCLSLILVLEAEVTTHSTTFQA